MKVLFVCKSNVGRSQMAEAFFAEMAKNHHAMSAGVEVSTEHESRPISKRTKKVAQVMRELGYNIDNKVMNQITPNMVSQADKVIVLNKNDYTIPAFLTNSPKLEIWDIPDAGGTDYEFHVKVRDMIQKKIKELVETL